MAKGEGPGFLLGQVVNQPQMHRWHHLGKIPAAAAGVWAKDVKPGFDLDSWVDCSGVFVSVDEKLLLHKESGVFRLLVWRKPD